MYHLRSDLGFIRDLSNLKLRKLPAKPARRGFTDEEKSAMRERVRELKAGSEEGEGIVLAKIAAMSEPDRTMARRVHAIIKATAPTLTPRLWYGMPAYAKDDKTIVHFQDAKKFKMRYATLGFSDKASIDQGPMWPVAYALMELTPAAEAKIAELVKKALG